MNYSETDTKDIVETYLSKPQRTTVELLANKYNKSPRSIIGKLSREGVYKRVEYRTKTGETPITKLEIVENISSILGCEVLAGLEKSPKETLKKLEKGLQKVLGLME